MSLLKEIQDAAIDGMSDLETLLRKCRVLAEKLKHAGFKNWVQSELNGYANNAELPDYRKFHCPCFGYFVGPMGAAIKDAPIAEYSIPEKIRDQLTNIELRLPVSELKELGMSVEKGSLRNQWPADACCLISGQYAAHYALVQAWTAMSPSVMVGILSIVRNRILDFALEIEAANPAAGEAAPGTTPVPTEKVTQVFNTYITGNVGNVAAGHNIAQTATVNIQQGDFGSLTDFLKSQGLQSPDIEELEIAIRSDLPATKKGFGPKVAGWLGKMVSKAASGAWKVALDTAPGVVSEALKQYFGL